MYRLKRMDQTTERIKSRAKERGKDRDREAQKRKSSI